MSNATPTSPPHFTHSLFIYLALRLLKQKLINLCSLFLPHFCYAFLLCLSKSMPHTHTRRRTHFVACPMPHAACYAPRKSLALRRPGANFIIYSLTRRVDDIADYVAPEGRDAGGWTWAGSLLILTELRACSYMNNTNN